ncbi:MAG: hypothetical protein ABI589_15130, partial [Burkholderiales bacterium]
MNTSFPLSNSAGHDNRAAPARKAGSDPIAPLSGVTPAWVRSQLVGRDASCATPFGERRLIYADHVASGRSLRWIEAFILAHILPHYGNTHTEDSATGARMT